MSAFSDFMERVPAGPIGVAVSGGSDSRALLVLATEWAQGFDRVVHAVSVDHGLRAEAATEAEEVARLCKELGVLHRVLRWDGQHQGNTQDAARRARYGLIGGWARDLGLSAVATGHTKDDQAETFLLRLKRGSGVDGLSGMAEQVTRDGVLWVRPLLGESRADLRDLLVKRGLNWVEDPSNDDMRFDRVKMRKALALLNDVGIDADVLAATAGRLEAARHALETATLAAAKQCAEPRAIGSVRLQVAGLAAHPKEIQLRLLAHTLGWVSGAEYRPRFSALKSALQGVFDGKGHSLSGCLVLVAKDGWAEVCREAAALAPVDAATGRFDGRWRCDPTEGEWRALGQDGLQMMPDWRGTAERRETLLSSPSLWYNNELKSAPFVDNTNAWRCSLLNGPESFFASVLSH